MALGNGYDAMPLFKLSIRRLCEVVKDVQNDDDFTFAFATQRNAARTSFNSPARQFD